MNHRANTPPDTTEIGPANDRVLATARRLDQAAWSEPSLLPGWDRARVFAHLALNAEALALALTAAGHDVPMYQSQELRDQDIERLAEAGRDSILPRLEVSAGRLDDAFRVAPDDAWSAHIPRVPGGAVFAARDVPTMRLRELEIHHADLGADYTYADWSLAFSEALLDHVVGDREAEGPFTLTASDLDRSWQVGGQGGPEVTGTAAALGWWLTGRDGAVVDSHGQVPVLDRWR